MNNKTKEELGDEEVSLEEKNELRGLYTKIQEAKILIEEKKKLLIDTEKSLNELQDMLIKKDKNRMLALEVSLHAQARVHRALEQEAQRYPDISKVVFNTENPDVSLLWPSQLDTFILNLIGLAYERDQYIVIPNEKTGAKQYHYNIELKEWEKDKKMIFTIVVENFTVITGYFNWK